MLLWWTLGACVRGDLETTLDGYERRGFNGVVRVVQGDQVLVDRAIGDADRLTGRANTLSTEFSIGSVTKQFTAAAVLKAQEDGLLRVDHTLADHLDDVPDAMADLSLHQLLTHTAGLVGAVGADEDVLDQSGFLALVWASELGVVGEFSYSNVGYGLLAAVLETRTGFDYETLIRTWFFGPLDMVDTGYDDPIWEALAHGSHRGDDFGAPITARYDADGPFYNVVGNGEIISTLDDLWRWQQALRAGTVLSPESMAQLYGHHVETWDQAWYGYGWGIEDWGDGYGVNVNHDGSNGYFYAHVIDWLDQDLWVAVLSNRRQLQSPNMAWKLSEAVFAP